jgi:hypothetical protein
MEVRCSRCRSKKASKQPFSPQTFGGSVFCRFTKNASLFLQCLATITIVAGAASCRSTSPKTKNMRQQDDLQTDPRDGFFLDAASFIDDTRVHPIQMDNAMFRISKVRVSEMLRLRMSTPILTYELPAKADYVQIIRCPSDVMLSGGQDFIEDVEMKASSLKQETEIFSANNFWESAQKGPGCDTLSERYADPYFFDDTAPTGEYVYYLRACIEEGRLIRDNQDLVFNVCSRQVTRSNAIKHQNMRSAAEGQAFKLARTYQDRIYKLTAEFVPKSQLLAAAIVSCQNAAGQPATTSQEASGLKKILAIAPGIGAAIGGVVAGSVAGAVTYRSGGSGIAATHATLAGVAAGAMVGYITGAIAPVLAGSVPIPRSASACYRRSEDQVQQALTNYQLMLAHKELTPEMQLCSCADIETLKSELSDMHKQLDLLRKEETQVLAPVNQAKVSP